MSDRKVVTIKKHKHTEQGFIFDPTDVFGSARSLVKVSSFLDEFDNSPLITCIQALLSLLGESNNKTHSFSHCLYLDLGLCHGEAMTQSDKPKTNEYLEGMKAIYKFVNSYRALCPPTHMNAIKVLMNRLEEHINSHSNSNSNHKG